MNLISKEKALAVLKNLIGRGRALRPSTDITEWQTWERDVIIKVAGIFGKGSSQVEEITPTIENMRRFSSGGSKSGEEKRPVGILTSMYSEIEDFWSDEGINSPSEKSELQPRPAAAANNSTVFIVHGHDHGRMQAVARFIEKLGLTATILHEQPNRGATVVEKLESHGNASFAIVLLTPDDVGAVATNATVLRPRARQNVVLELGYFIARLGRRNTCALVAGDVEIPSDYSGIVYVPLDTTDAWKFHLAKELKAAGLEIDQSKIL